MNAQVPDVVAQQTLAIMRSNDVVVFSCRQEGSTVIGKGEDLLKQIVASKVSQPCRVTFVQVENEDAAAFLIAFYGVSSKTVH